LESRKTKAAAAGGTRGPTGAAKSLMVEPAKLHTLQMKVDGDEGASDDEEDDDPYMKEYHLIGHGGKVVPGDLCWFPDMMTGGGDFEGVFFAAPPTAKEPHDSVRLLSTDCECMDFPQEIVDLVGGADKLEAHFSAAMEEADQDWLEFDDIFTNVRDPDGEGPPPVMIEGGSLPRVAVVYQPVPKDDAK